MNTFNNKFDTLEKMIFEDDLRITKVHFHKELDLMVIILNNRKVLTSRISVSKLLVAADEQQLNNYKLISNGIGIHWPALDEDLSLKGFLAEELIKSVVLVG